MASSLKCLIINFNRLTLPMNMANWLAVRGCEPIFVDNHSDYPPLLAYYNNCPYQVYIMDKNYRHTVIWDQGLLDKIGIEGNYIVTDPDLDLRSIPANFVSVLEEGLRRYPRFEKCGFSLEINGAGAGYAEWEKQFWCHPLDSEYFEAAIDTTFALYRVRHHAQLALRTNRPYTAKHVPWYYSRLEDMPVDEQYYMKTTELSHVLGGIVR